MTIWPIDPEHSPSYDTLKGVIQEKSRIGYNADTKRFKPMQGMGKNIAHIEPMSNLPMPTDYTSPTYLKNLTTAHQPSGARISTDTKGVKEFVSGNPALHSSFISSIIQAQRNI